MKKRIALLLTSALLLTALVGCNNGKTDSGSGSSGNAGSTGTTDTQTPSGGKTLSGSVATDGSTSVEKVIGALGESFTLANKDVTFTYNPTGSGSGITAVSEGRCDIGLSSRGLKDAEKEGGLIETVFALDGIAMIVNTENTVSDLTIEQIAAIYTGEITNWSEDGGDDAAIVPIGREAGSGTRDGF